MNHCRIPYVKALGALIFESVFLNLASYVNTTLLTIMVIVNICTTHKSEDRLFFFSNLYFLKRALIAQRLCQPYKITKTYNLDLINLRISLHKFSAILLVGLDNIILQMPTPFN